MTRVFDSFMIADELDMLECRLTELEDADVTHVLVEATADHWGNPKPLFYDDNKSRYEKWASRIIHVIAGDLDPGPDRVWGYENAQREAVWRGLRDAEPDDILIHADCDEILRAEAVQAARAITGGGLRFQLRHLIFACDWEIVNGEVMDQSCASRIRDVKSVTGLRRGNSFPALGGMGWHMSFFGGPEGVIRKMRRDCHPEVRAEVTRMAREGLCYEKGMFWQDPRRATPVDVDETWPKYVREGRAPAIWYRPR